MNLIKKPYLPSWFLAIVCGFIAYFGSNTTIDINVHDTYYIVAKNELYLGISILYFLTGFGYWIVHKFRKRLISFLTFTHFIVAILLPSLIIFFDVANSILNASRYYINSNLSTSYILTELLFIGLFILGKVLYIINIFVALVRNKTSKL